LNYNGNFLEIVELLAVMIIWPTSGGDDHLANFWR